MKDVGDVSSGLEADEDWVELVNRELAAKEVGKLRTSVKRGRPFGGEAWRREAARRMGLEHTFREAGRPRKKMGARGAGDAKNQ